MRPLDKDKFVKPLRESKFRTKKKSVQYINTTEEEVDTSPTRNRTYFKTLEQMVLSAPREKHELQEGKALKDMKAALQHGYYEQKRKMGGTIDIKDKPLMHQVMVKCNYLNKQESNFLAKQSLNYKAHNMNDMNDAGSIFNR